MRTCKCPYMRGWESTYMGEHVHVYVAEYILVYMEWKSNFVYGRHVDLTVC